MIGSDQNRWGQAAGARYNPAPMKQTTIAILAASIATLAPAFAGDGKAATPVIEQKDIVVHPVTGPYFHEDSFITTDLRTVFAYHHFPGEILGGGHATVAALQLRVALTQSLQLVAYKDGWMDIDTPGLDDEGWNDIALGLKWAFIQNDAAQFHAAVGVGYEIATGDDNVLQDDDELRLWASVNKGFGRLHLGATVNYLHSLGNGDSILGDSDMLSWHLHADYHVCDWFSPLIEVNGYHVLDEGSPVTPFSGADVANLGGNDSEHLITAAAGIEIRPHERIALRAAYELPLTDDVDVFGHRWTFSAVIKF